MPKVITFGELMLRLSPPGFERLLIDASRIEVHPHAAGAKGGNQGMGRTEGGAAPSCVRPRMRMACRSESLLRKVPRRIARELAA